MGIISRIVSAIVDEAREIKAELPRQLAKARREAVVLKARNAKQKAMLANSHRNNSVLRREIAHLSGLRLAVKRAGAGEPKQPRQIQGNDYY